MSTEPRDLASLVEKLRQEQEFSLFYKTQIRQTIQEINQSCDRVFQGLWLSQCLGYGLDRTKVHHLQGGEWTLALEQAGYAQFVDAVRIFRSSSLVANYNKFLAALLDSPALLARVLVWVESESRDSASLINDLISVVYGHCVFQNDHTLFLRLLKELLSHLVASAASPKDLFSGVEPIFCRVLTEYCNQLADLQTFLVQAFEEPLAEVLSFDDYLEFDVCKAGTRYQTATENSTGGRLLDGSNFLFGEDLGNSCQHLARLATLFVDVLRRHADHFPPSLKWVLSSLKSLVRAKWPEVSALELRRPVSCVLFGPVLGSIMVNPDSHGLCDMQVVVSPVARYNLSQVTSVLQGCAWVQERQGGKYPMQKVIRKMNTEAYCDLLDSLDGDCSAEIPDLPSSLPGLNRTVNLASQAQLNNLVGLVCEVATDLTRKTDSTPEASLLGKLGMKLHQSIKQMATSVPYLSPSLPPRSRTMKPHSLRAADSGNAALGGKPSARKRASGDVKSPIKPTKRRSSSTSNLNQILVGGVSSSSTRTATRSISPNQMLYTHHHRSESLLHQNPRGQNSQGTFQVPSEVLILPVSKDGHAPSRRSQSGPVIQWDFTLLSEEEFMQRASCNEKADPLSPSYQHPSTPHTQHTSTPHTEHTSTLHTEHNLPTQEHIPNHLTLIPDVPMTNGMEPRHGLQNGMESGSNSTTSLRSPVRELWERRSNRSRTGSGPNELKSAGSDSSVNACMSSREPSSSPQIVPKKRSFTITSVENGKFMLDVNLSPLHHRSHPHTLPSSQSPPPHSPTSAPAITTTPPPLPTPSITSPPPPLVNGDANSPSPPRSPSHPPLISSSTHSSDSRSAGLHYAGSPIKERLSTSWQSSQDAVNHPNHELSPSNLELSASDLERPSSDAETPAVGSSVENLLGDDQPGTPKSSGKGEGKKKKWTRFRRKKKDKKKMKSQLSLQEDGREGKKIEIVEKKQRSKSDFAILEDGPSKENGVKLRSSTQDALDLQDVEDDLENSPRAVFKKRRSYTILDKYYAIVMEQKRRAAPMKAMPEKVESLPRFVSQRVEEMDPETFRQSLFCNQLEYKLRAGLQNVHTPLASSPTHCPLRVDNSNCDFKPQLLTLLRCALQRSKWVHDDMETALLSETLTMVNKLPNSLVSVAIECAHREQEKRKTYMDYLVKSHVRFLDVRLQVGALQSAIDRRQEILKEQFVRFAVWQFLDMQTDQLTELDQNITSLSLADERCSLMKEELEVFTETLLEDQTWSHWPRESTEMVKKYLEDQLFSIVYPHVFQPNMEVDKDKDKIFSSHLSSLSKVLTPTHKSLQISPIYHSGCPWMSAQKHLKAMSLFKSPRGKVRCIAESCRVLISLLQYAKVGSPPGADDLFPVLVYVLIKANPPALLSTIQYIRNFLEEDLEGEESYWWVQFSTAVEFTKTLE